MGKACSIRLSGLAVPSGTISCNHFLASVLILYLSSVLKRDASNCIILSQVGRWVRKMVPISLVMPWGSTEKEGACFVGSVYPLMKRAESNRLQELGDNYRLPLSLEVAGLL